MSSRVLPRDHRPLRRVLLVAGLVLALLASPTSSAATAEDTPSVLRRAALTIEVTTSSDWVRIDLPGISAGHVTVSGTRTVRPTHRGIVVNGPARVKGSVTVDVVTEVDPAQVDGWISVAQGGAGWSSVRILNRTAVVYEVAKISTSWSSTKAWAPVTIDRLMGPTQLEWVRADQERRILAFTYPWFGPWAKTNPALKVHPTDPWISSSAESALLQAQRARRHGIDGFVMSFSGGAKHGLPLHHSLSAAEATGGTATVLIETTATSSAAELEQWIVEALRQSDSPAFQRLDGVPVVFAFATGTYSPDTWKGISGRLAAAGTPVRIITDTWAPTTGASAGLYRYNALLRSLTNEITNAELTFWNQSAARGLRARATLGVGEPGLVVATVQPGWDRWKKVEGELVIDRDGTATFDRTWEAALAGEPDWVVITSWEEWYEGTGIAPSVEYGTTALKATARWAAAFEG